MILPLPLTWKAKISGAKMVPQWNHSHVHSMDPFQVVIVCLIYWGKHASTLKKWNHFSKTCHWGAILALLFSVLWDIDQFPLLPRAFMECCQQSLFSSQIYKKQWMGVIRTVCGFRIKLNAWDLLGKSLCDWLGLAAGNTHLGINAWGLCIFPHHRGRAETAHRQPCPSCSRQPF